MRRVLFAVFIKLALHVAGKLHGQCAQGDTACSTLPDHFMFDSNKKEVSPFESLFHQVLQDTPGFKTNVIFKKVLPAIPDWHASMLNDRERNSAYRRAIEKAVTNQSVVLDIGAGAGLLSMYAARAGARQVVTFEGNANVHKLALTVFKRNNFSVSAKPGVSAQIVCLHQHSTSARVGKHLQKPATVLVAELMDTSLLAEGMLPIFAHAQANLLAPGAIVIPARGRFHFMAIESPFLRTLTHVATDAAEFDLSDVNDAMNRAYKELIDLSSISYRAISTVGSAFEMDFYNASKIMPTLTHKNLTATSDGILDAIAIWWEVDLDDEISISMDPRRGGGRGKNWLHLVFRNKPRNVLHGNTIKLLLGHSEQEVKAEIYGIV